MNKSITNSDAIFLLQQWYLSQCDGDWEHSYGIKIDTLDNPGWILTIDLVDTDLSAISIQRDRIDRSETDWAQHEIVDAKFIACGGVFNLEELVRRFLTVLENTKI